MTRLTSGPGRKLRFLAPFSACVVLLAGGGFAALESHAVSSFGEGVWWALSLMTTVGFIGETPTTTAGQVLSAVLMVVGFLLLATTTAGVASLFVKEEEEPSEARSREFERTTAARLDEIVRRLDRLDQERTERTDPGGAST